MAVPLWAQIVILVVIAIGLGLGGLVSWLVRRG